MISNFVKVIYKWMSVIKDGDESFNPNLSRVYMRSTSDKLQLRIETNEDWGSIEDSTGINCAIFLDTDQNNGTGLSPDTLDNMEGRRILDKNRSSYSINDIGAEYAIALGIDGSGLYFWQDSVWLWQNSINYLNFKNDTNIVELEVNRSDLNNPARVDVVVASITFDTRNRFYWDWAPDSLHVSYTIDSNYIGN